ncbi:MAG: hypothetical protein ABW223_10265 [Rariglobus sp.]
MKTKLLALLLVVSPLVAKAGDVLAANVPAPVTGYVAQHFPKASAIEWDFEKDENVYEADFKIDGFEHELKISPAGALVYSEIDIVLSALPAAVSSYLKTHHANATLLGAKKVVKAGQLKYEVALVQDGFFGKKRHKNIYISEAGARVSK